MCSSKNAARTESMEQKVLGKDEKKQKQKKLLNFYSFQMRESKMERKFWKSRIKLISVN